MSVSLTGSTGYLEKRQLTHIHSTAQSFHHTQGTTERVRPLHTHPLNGWSLVVIGKLTNTHTNTNMRPSIGVSVSSAAQSNVSGVALKVQSCFSACCVPCAMCCMPGSQHLNTCLHNKRIGLYPLFIFTFQRLK